MTQPASSDSATLQHMSSIDLRRLGLRPGEVRDERSTSSSIRSCSAASATRPTPRRCLSACEITQASGATVFDLRLHARLAGPCMRCLGFAEVEVDAYGAGVLRPFGAASGRAPLRLRRRRPARGRSLGARRGRPRAPRADPLPLGLRRALPRVRQGSERRAARAHGARRRSALGAARGAARPLVRRESCGRSTDSHRASQLDPCRSHLHEAIPGNTAERRVARAVRLDEELDVSLLLERERPRAAAAGTSATRRSPSGAARRP